jgi:hypothetical protein
MKRCPNCGAEVEDQARFCSSCGAPLAPVAEELVFESASETVEPPVQPVDPLDGQPAPQEDDFEFTPPVYGSYEQQIQQEEPASSEDYYASAPPTYGYEPQAQQEQPAPQEDYYAPDPPAYGYEPQQPPTYGYAQQSPSYQETPAYDYPPQEPVATKPKKKRRWLILVIVLVVVAALLLGTYLIFGDQIKRLLGLSAPEPVQEINWIDAEKALLTADDVSMLSVLQSTVTQKLDQKKFGMETSISIDVNVDDPDAAAILDMVRNLRLTFGGKIDTGQDDLRFHAKIGLGNRNKAGDALTLQIYNVDDNIVVDATPIIEKPLVFRPEAFEELLDVDDGVSDLFSGDLSEITDAMKSLADLLSSSEKIGHDLLDIVAKYAEEPKIEKGAELSLAGISQKFTKYTIVINAEKTPDMLKGILTYIRDNKDIRKVVEELGAFSEKLDPPAPGDPYSSSFTYEDFVASINDEIKEIEENRDDFSVEFRRELYLDDQGKPQAGTLTVFMIDGEDKEQVFTLSHVHVEAKDKHAFKFSAQPEGDNGVFFTSEYTLNNNLYTGTFKLCTVNEGDAEQIMATGDFNNFGFEEADGQLYPVGKLDIKPQSSEADEYSLFPTQGGAITYEGKVEKKDDGSHLMATISVEVPDDMMSVKLTVSLDHRSLSEDDIAFETALPSDYIDVRSLDTLEELFEDDPGLMFRLMQVLAELGIDMSMFFSDFD